MTVQHEGFIKGQPPRYRHIGEMKTLLETDVEIVSITSEEAPVAFVQPTSREDGRMDYRFHDGFFMTEMSNSDFLLTASARGAIPMSAFGREGFHDEYRHLCSWRDYASRSVGGDGPARQLHEWQAKSIDETNRYVFEDAVRETMTSLLTIDRRFWVKTFEPCMRVEWSHGRDGSLSIGIAPADTRNLHGRMRVETRDGFGLREIAPTAYSVFRPSAIVHERCFSVLEAARMEEFVVSLQRAASGKVTVDRSAKKLESILDEVCSPDFDVLEVGRSARLYNAAWQGVEHQLRDAKGKKWKSICNVDEMETRTAEIEFALRDFEGGKGSPEEVLEAMKALRTGLDYVVRKAERDWKLEISMFYPPEYFGDPDNMVVEVDFTKPLTSPKP